ncbi:MAG TPA: hypothetical protein VIV12_00455, partial [Streptosporangiaceae bacterium]
ATIATGMIDSVVQHLCEGIADDSPGRTLPVQVQVAGHAVPDRVLGKTEQREFVVPRGFGIHDRRQWILRQRAARFRGPNGPQIEQSVATSSP